MSDKPHIFLRDGLWRVGYGDKIGTFSSLPVARMAARSIIINRAGAQANREADRRMIDGPYVNPRAG